MLEDDEIFDMWENTFPSEEHISTELKRLFEAKKAIKEALNGEDKETKAAAQLVLSYEIARQKELLKGIHESPCIVQ